MSLNQQHQNDIDGVTPMPTDRVDDTSVVNDAIAETVVWSFSDSGVWAAAATEAAGTICVSKLTYSGITNALGSSIGHKNDTSLSFAAATRAETLVTVPEVAFSQMEKMSVADKVLHIATWLTANGDYAIDHRRGQVWMKAKAEVANDSVTYKYQTPLSGDVVTTGLGNPSVDSYTTVAINLTTAANQVLVASAADKQIWVYGYGLTCGDADGQTVSLQDEDDTALTGIMEFGQYGGISVPPSGNFSMPVFKLATNKDLEIDITGGDVDGWLSYALISV